MIKQYRLPATENRTTIKPFEPTIRIKDRRKQQGKNLYDSIKAIVDGYLRSASGVVDLTGEEHPPLAIHYQGPGVMRDLSSYSLLAPLALSCRRRRAQRSQHG